MTIAYCYHPSPFLSGTWCYMGNRSDCLTQLQCHSVCNRSFLFSLWRDEEVLQGHLRLQGKSLLSDGPCCRKFLFFCVIILPPSACASEGIFDCLAMGCGFPADSTWNQLSNSASVSLMSCSLLFASCSSASGFRKSFTWAQLLHAGLPCAPEGRYNQFLKSEVCITVSPFSNSIWVEALSSTGVDGGDTPDRPVGFAFKWVPTILSWGLAWTNALDLWRTVSSDLRTVPSGHRTSLLGYVYFNIPLIQWNGPPWKRWPPCMPSQVNCHTSTDVPHPVWPCC